jgi:uncharacterized protein (TIGR03435 family)
LQAYNREGAVVVRVRVFASGDVGAVGRCKHYPIVTRGNGTSTSSGGIVKCTGVADSISSLTRWLTNIMGHQVIDRTGLTGRYDFRLEFAGSGWSLPFPKPMPSTPPPADEASDWRRERRRARSW